MRFHPQDFGKSQEKDAIASFDSSWKQFQIRQTEALELSVRNTNSKAALLLNGKIAENTTAIEAALIPTEVDPIRWTKSRFA